MLFGTFIDVTFLTLFSNLQFQLFHFLCISVRFFHNLSYI